jgi:hypothetical protein
MNTAVDPAAQVHAGGGNNVHVRHTMNAVLSATITQHSHSGAGPKLT